VGGNETALEFDAIAGKTYSVLYSEHSEHRNVAEVDQRAAAGSKRCSDGQRPDHWWHHNALLSPGHAGSALINDEQPISGNAQAARSKRIA